MSNVIAANKQMDLFAKLLAKENISVERANVSTASFDILNRVLTLPVWKHMAPVTEQMLILHEVGHALATNKDECEDIFGGELSYLKSYVNVIEDARIERIMKQKYPGSKKVFFDGYKNLLDQDFFGIRERDVNRMLLIDRINIHFKTGSLMTVQFSEDESVFVKRIEEVKTLTEVIEIAKEIYEFSKQQKGSWDADLNIKLLYSETEEDAEYSGQTRYYQDDEFDDTESDDAESDEETPPELLFPEEKSGQYGGKKRRYGNKDADVRSGRIHKCRIFHQEVDRDAHKARGGKIKFLLPAEFRVRASRAGA